MPFPSDDVIHKALSLDVAPLPDPAPGISGVTVAGHTDTYHVYAHRDGFMCDCRASADHSWTEPRCSHTLAAMVWWAGATPPPEAPVALGGRSAIPDAKPATRVKLGGSEWHALIGQKDGWRCRVCGKHSHWSGMSAHHYIKRSQGGDDVAANGAYLCGSGTTGCHGAVEAARPYELGKLRQAMLTEEIAYIVHAKSMAWLEQHYPVT